MLVEALTCFHNQYQYTFGKTLLSFLCCYTISQLGNHCTFNSAVFIWKLKLIVNFEITIIHILPVR